MATTTTFNGKKVHQGMIKSQKTRVGDFIIAFIIFLTMLICLLPMVNVLASSLSSSEHLIRNDVFLWPKGWNFEAYKTILSDSKYTWSLAWTGILTVVCTVLSLVLTVCTAFPLIYKNLRGGKVIHNHGIRPGGGNSAHGIGQAAQLGGVNQRVQGHMHRNPAGMTKTDGFAQGIRVKVPSAAPRIVAIQPKIYGVSPGKHRSPQHISIAGGGQDLRAL